MTQEFATAFTQLKPHLQRIWEEMQAQQYTKELVHAPRFNIFNMLGIAHLEDRTHSPFLANLLNPRGSHSQGFLFLSAFLRFCAQKWPHRPFLLSDSELRSGRWYVQREVGINLDAGPKGFLDIVLSNTSSHCVIVIENKINANERHEQLSRYRDWLESIYPHYDQALIFLNPTGRASTTGIAYTLSYQEDITSWLNNVLPDIRAENVQIIIRQYLSIIEPKKEILMTQNDPLLELILKPDNLPLIRAVAQQFDTFCMNAQWYFWRGMGNALQTKFDNSVYIQDWELRKVEQKDAAKPWHGCYLQQKSISTNQAELRFAFRQGHPSNFPEFYFGIRWIENRPTPLYIDFQAQLYNLTKPYPTSTHPNWPVFHRFNFGPNSDEFLIKMYQSPEPFVAELADVFWTLFQMNADSVAEINSRQL